MVVMVFGQTLHHDFVNFDDDAYVYKNPRVSSGLTYKGFVWAFTKSHASNWHPLTWLTHMMDCQLYGLKAGGHHLTNILLHTANAILFFLVLLRITQALWLSALVAALFAVHPLRVESVAWVAERKDVLSGLFFMLTLWAYTSYVRSSLSLVRYLLALILYALGLMAKPMLVTLPFVLLLLDHWPLRRTRSLVIDADGSNGQSLARLILEKLPFLMLAALSCIITLYAQTKSIRSLDYYPILLRLQNVLVSYASYIFSFFCPTNLVPLYLFPEIGFSAWQIFGCSLVLAAISAISIAYRKKYPFMIVAWLWYLGMLVPVIGLVQVGQQTMADRYTYLPQIGLYILIVWTLNEIVVAWPYFRSVCAASCGVILVILILMSRHQASYWANSETLWRHTLDRDGRNYLAHHNFANYLGEQKRYDDAIHHYQEGLSNGTFDHKQQNFTVHNNLANYLAERKQFNDAFRHYEEALKLNPNSAEARSNFGQALDGAGRMNDAMAQYEQALKIDPEHALANNNMGVALSKRGQTVRAIEYYEKALRNDSDSDDFHYNLGIALSDLGRVDEAIHQYQLALEINPRNSNVRQNLGNVLLGQRRLDEAVSEYQKVLEINPQEAESHNNLAAALMAQGKLSEAISHLREALEIEPHRTEFHINLGLLLKRQGQLDEANKHFEMAKNRTLK